ncbi:MAG: type II toxin-antitoxin system RelE/ParE family toxin [Cyclobacteriaceae bacterium]|nr:type II toxin-antitoxin system RelE/ParE family toxin [Cyclobacteriaceae bacterium]
MEVYVTPRAEKHFDQIVEYLTTKWGAATAKHFIEKSDSVIKLLKNYPAMGPIESGEIRGFQLTKQIRILYRIKKDQLIILAFFDVRQNPEKKFS